MHFKVVEYSESYLHEEKQHENKCITCACRNIQRYREEKWQMVHNMVTQFGD